MKSEKVTLFWFRRDLRIEDNRGLYEALSNNERVLPIFIFDEEILVKLPDQDARVSFIHEKLLVLNDELSKKYNTGIALYHGNPQEIFQSLLMSQDIKNVYTNHDYEPYAIKRDQEISNILSKSGVEFLTFKDQVIFEKNEVLKNDGDPYVVYTPYMRKWKETFNSNTDIPNYQIGNVTKHFYKGDFNKLSLSDIGFKKSNIEVHPYNISSSLIGNYHQTRDFPAQDGTSLLGPHLRFGTVSIRRLVEKALNEKDTTFLNELIWREFFMQILYHFPHTTTKSFKPKYDRINWRNDENEFMAWCEGKTGYPIVDAGMRQLNNTGYMHNRIRMITASFLCKHLLIDWRWGEAYFAQKLLDYEMSSNVGNWQWVAGTGVDAAPYFRIFNPITQIKKFDKDLKYINTWVKDLNEFSYPQPIVEHKAARERCLEVYKNALN
ncbi:deoxyribodipyrimidine photo-lyase [Zhouia amylolytica]|uniref:Deoxyribodipyrimidine photo-lyase n=1 Tax=Zhouia amylolytica TaxID=376730 RepID=A0A1I6TD07_9FLAO|nr:deoxyribodipyrimidine photo-lyase [Zhouia amylolytica]SFS87072.1 deoxyribodipyrimidine photo-lyase [Zhouia amylolytica]